MKKLIALLLLTAMLASMVACGSKEPQEPVQTLNPIPTAVQKEYTTQNVIDIFNEAVKKIAQAKSYHMSGSVNSTAVMSSSMATVVTSIDCDYADNNGSPVMLMKSSINDGSKVQDHVTYNADGKYYFEALGQKYYTDSNDYTDYHALNYLREVRADIVSELEIRDELDGGVSVQFTVKFGDYPSEALSGWLGFMDDNVSKQPVTIRADIGADGKMKGFYMTLASQLSMGAETIDQTIVLSLQLSGYDTTEVVAPSDLDSYLNWSNDSDYTGGQNPEGGQNPDGNNTQTPGPDRE